MERDFARLESQPFDLLVVGGGVYGAWVAYDAAMRGLQVALVEKNDWASGTSSASSKLIHGGLRYLEQGAFRLVHRSLKERSLLLRLAPHRVNRLRFLLPVYRGDRLGQTRLRAGLWLYDLLAGRPTADRRQSLGRRELLRLHDLEPQGLVGGFTFGDGQTDDARFTLEIVDGAVAAGAVAVNWAAVRELRIEGSEARGAIVEDRESGRLVPVQAAAVIACAGAWSRSLLGGILRPSKPAPRLTKGVHLVMPRLVGDEALLIPSDEDRRVVFVIPWYGRSLLGTTDTDYEGAPEQAQVEPADVTYLLDRANRVLRGAPWTPEDVISSFVGLRTLPATEDRLPSVVTREWRLEQPLKNLLAHVGGKLTSARADAAVAVDRVLAILGRNPMATATDRQPFPWSPGENLTAWSRETLRMGLAMGLDEETVSSCQARYGSRVTLLYELFQEAPDLARRIVPELPFCLAEIVHAVTGEMARTLEDVLRRRVPLLLLTRLDETTLQRIAMLVGQLLEWTEQRRRIEVACVLSGRDPLSVHETA